VGHTHEDIDALFAKIWEYIKSECVLTPQAYEKVIIQALSKPDRPVKVVDLFAVPDYKSLLDELICDGLSNYMKEEETQLQFIFESVPVSEEYPFGVKVQYRAYSSDNVVEIWVGEGENFPYGFQPVEVKVDSHPVDIIKELPKEDCRIYPQQFVAGSRVELEKVANFMISECSNTNLSAAKEWTEFLDFYPRNDNVMSFLAHTGPLELPLFDEIFKGVPFTTREIPQVSQRKMWNSKNLRKYQAEPSLGHERGTVPTRTPVDGLPSELPNHKKTQKSKKQRIEEPSNRSEPMLTSSLDDIRNHNIERNRRQLQLISDSLGMSELMSNSAQMGTKEVRKGQHKVKKVYEKRVTTSRVSKTDAAAKITECTQAEKDDQGRSI